MKKELDFGVFYTCFTEKESVTNAINTLYSVYPSIPVYLISDGGENYKNLEETYPFLKTNLEEDSRGFVPSVNLENYKEDLVQEKMVKSIFVFLERIKRACDFCKKPYILIMEPDVLVRGKLHIEDGVHLLGSRINNYHWAKDEINHILKDIDGSIPVTHYGATPAIFSVESFMKVYSFFKENSHYVEMFCQIDPNFSNYDIFITVLFSALGFYEYPNEELTECFRNLNWKNTKHPLIHQYRELYPKKNYTGRHANGN